MQPLNPFPVIFNTPKLNPWLGEVLCINWATIHFMWGEGTLTMIHVLFAILPQPQKDTNALGPGLVRVTLGPFGRRNFVGSNSGTASP